MSNYLFFKKKIKPFNKTISISGDKSLSIRWVLFSSLANGVSTAKNLLLSEDVKAALKAIKGLGIKYKQQNGLYKIFGKGLSGYNTKKKTTINAFNSGTLGRLIMGLLIDAEKEIKIIGDKSLSKRDFKRISDPLSKFGSSFNLKNKKNLPLIIKGSKILKPINYNETRGSAQCKSAVIFAGLKTNGITKIKAKKSRNHTELLCKHLKLPVKVTEKNNFDYIEVKKAKQIKPLNYNIPSDISSAAFFIALTVLSENSKLIIKNVNINPTRTGIIKILKMMGVKIIFKNVKNYKGEKIADIVVKSCKNLKAINCPSSLNSGAIDEFLLIFLIAARAKGVSYFKDLSELNQKESPRLDWGNKILNLMGVKTILKNNSIKIFGNPNLNVDENIIIKDYLKDHRIFMSSVIASLTFGGNWKIYDPDSIKTSFPQFNKIIKSLN